MCNFAALLTDKPMNYIDLINEQATTKFLTGHTRTAANYRTAGRALNRFLQARGISDLHIQQFTTLTALQLEDYLLNSCEVCPNTSSFYFRQLRAVYNTAVREGLCDDQDPFRQVYKSVATTRKRAAGPEDLKRLFTLDLSQEPKLAFARDLFRFSFLGRGIAFVDLAKLQQKHVQGNHLAYQRSKTGQQVIVELPETMVAIIRRWHQPASRYLFPILPQPHCPRDYDTALRSYNRRLAKLSERCHFAGDLTSYIARHSWASEAYRLGVPIQAISACMGHTTEQTTRIYLRSLSTQHLDRSAQPVLDAYA